MKIFTFLLFTFYIQNVFATFTLIAVDTKTNQAGISLASCVKDIELKVADSLVTYHPEQGISCLQGDNSLENIGVESVIYNLMENQDPFYTAQYINHIIIDNYQDYFQGNRQILTIKKIYKNKYSYHALTGIFLKENAWEILGTTQDKRYVYILAGNNLINRQVLEKIEKEFVNAEGSLDFKLMTAFMSVKANLLIGDQRCQKYSVSSHLAFLRTYQNKKIKYDLQYNSKNENHDAVLGLYKLYISAVSQKY